MVIFREKCNFVSSRGNAILNVSDEEMKKFANRLFGYTREKGLDFIARFNNTYVVGEAKFLTDFGGHQNAQFDDAVSTITSSFVSKSLQVHIVLNPNSSTSVLSKTNFSFSILSPLFMIAFICQNFEPAVDLLQKNYAHKLVGECHFAE